MLIPRSFKVVPVLIPRSFLSKEADDGDSLNKEKIHRQNKRGPYYDQQTTPPLGRRFDFLSFLRKVIFPSVRAMISIFLPKSQNVPMNQATQPS